MNGAHFSTWTDDPMFSNRMHANSNLLVHCAVESLAVLGMDHSLTVSCP